MSSCSSDGASRRPQDDALARALLEQADRSVIILDGDLRLVDCTPDWAQAFGRDRRSLVGEALEALYPNRPAAWLKAFEGALSAGEIKHGQDAVIFHGGDAVHLRWTVRPWRPRGEDIEGVTLVTEDVSARVAAEQSAIDANVNLRVCLAAASAGVWRLDLETHTLWTSPEYRDILRTRTQFEDFVSDDPPWVHPEDVTRYKDFLRRLKGPVGKARIEHRVAGSDPEIWLDATCERITNAEGKVCAFVGMARNVTEEKAAELRLLEATKRAEQALVHKRDMLAAILRDLDMPVMASPTLERTEADAEAGGFAELSARLLLVMKEIDIRDSALGETVMALRKSRELAEQASVAKSNFLANISHELRTPLNAIIGYSEMVLEDAVASSNADAAADLGRVISAARRLLSLINAVLDLTQIEAEDLELAVAPFDADDLAREVVDAFQREASAQGDRLELETACGAAVGDETRVKQCLSNLVSNACKFTRDGVVQVTAARSRSAGRDWLAFEVSDTGIGMTDEVMAGLFRPFMQADATVTRAYEGVGLGLAMARALARLMKGDIDVVSELGRGSTFTLRIPADLAAEGAAAEHAA